MENQYKNLVEVLVGKSIIESTADYILLNTGEKLEVKCTYSLNGAQAGGRWDVFEYHLPITNVVIGEFEVNPLEEYETEYTQTITLFYCSADTTKMAGVVCWANDAERTGRSICSLVMGDTIFEVLECGY